MNEVLKSYLKRLSNLSGNNRSLFLLRLLTDQFIDIHDFEFISKGGSFAIIEKLMAGSKVPLAPLLDSRDEESNVASTRLRRISRYDKFIYSERGSKDLYVGWPFVKGKLSNGTNIRCPLLFFPVSIDIVNEKWIMSPRIDAGITFNKSFLLAYSYYNEIPIEDDFIDRNFEDFDTNSTVFRTGLYQLLKDSPVELNFNQANFEDKLQAFQEFKKADFEANEKQGELKLYPEAVLGIFPQSGSQLVPDYVKLISGGAFKDIEDFFVERDIANPVNDSGLRQFSFLDSVDEERIIAPFEIDAHQENALKAIKKGKSLVIQGPPGTGKSQLICNLLADHIASGKKVLVVSQKRAALDVVYERMKEVEMTDFMGLVHDYRNDRKEVFAKIARQIHRIDEYKMRNNGLDTIQLERNFLQNSRRIDQITRELEEFKFALFDEEECGKSVKELYLTTQVDAPAINFKQEYIHFKYPDIDSFLIRLREYTDYAQRFNKIEHPWYDRKSFSGYSISDERRITELIDEIPAYKNNIQEQISSKVGAPVSFQDCQQLLDKRSTMVEMLGILKNDLVYSYFQHVSGFADTETNSLWLSNTERVLMECYKGEGPEVSLPSDQLGKFQETLQNNMDARRSPIKLIQWKLFSKDKFTMKRVLAANSLNSNSEGFKRLVERIDNRLNLEHNITKLAQKEWVVGIPSTYEKVGFQNWFYILKLAVKAKLIFNSFRNFKEFFHVQSLTYDELRGKIEALYAIIKEIPDERAKWEIHLSDSHINKLLNEKEDNDRLKSVLRSDFESLCEFDNIKETMNAGELKAIDKIIDETEDTDPKSIEALFLNSLGLAWIEHIETKYHVLRTVSSNKFLKQEADLQHLVQEKQSAATDMLQMKARERTYDHVEYNRLNNMVTYRELLHQVTKKRRLWPLRKLIDTHYEQLFDLMPCWLASPESVSAIFPMMPLFDLVIFDEASQCFVERGIPAMYRGRQILIAGDPMQLRPSDLYKVRFIDENEEAPELEVDSLLELANHHLMKVQLKGHYRSKSLDLIDFSNRHFYDGNLRLLPDYEAVNDADPAIDYMKVNDGIWKNNTNKAEAEKVVETLLSLIKNSPDKEVGVVTFNARQQTLIMDMVDEKMLELGQMFPESWFVKNIENIQGDEKDIIIFSTAYAPDESGRMMMQFGSLNMANGENRLNVAVTRAREKVMVITSIMPQQLQVDDAKNDGPKLLKKYLEYALNVSQGKFKPQPVVQSNHGANWYLKSRLKQWSEESSEFTLEESLPFADLTVKDEKNYLGLLLTDDDLYHQSPSVKDVHVYTPYVLSRKNWHSKLMFSREYWRDMNTTKDDIKLFINHGKRKME